MYLGIISIWRFKDMFNRIRTKEVFGYDIDPNKKSRRSDEEYVATKGILKKHLAVIDNCPSCRVEREIQFRNSLKNKPCSKCFHNTPEMQKIKLAQKGKTLTEEHKQKLKESHWCNKGMTSPFKGKGNNTEEQFNEWIDPTILNKPTIYLLVGAPSAGKSWVANQLLDKFTYISYDGQRKKSHLDLLRAAPVDRPILYDPTFKISTIIRRHSDEFNFILVGIYETEEVLRERMASRSGEFTTTIMKRNEVSKKRYNKYGAGGFLGTSSECLEFLKNI